MSDTKKEFMKMVSVFGTIGITVSACIFVGLAIGYYLDHKVFKDTSPWFTFIFLGFGIFAGFKNLYQLSKRKDF
ncbi:MAG: AtpZ/AtpI family protein [Desulfobulbaceae bacterium]|uniref:AtpZ/AtpI family protein n=1 Tax=Candidatus Desulfobia pelagia TaxID=2841692 RepID=A0A8J6TGH0_9BACT|nr:AtpZ/AtpI family protein [Candidatus Desulfobia pelagia]